MFMRLYCLKCRSRPCVCVLDGVICVGAVLLGVVCCLDHMAWASAAGMQSMLHISHITCTDAVVTPTISCTSPKTSCKAQHTCVANNKAAVAHRFQTVTAKTQMPNQQNHTQGKTDAQGPGLATVRDKFANTPVRQCVVLV